MRDNKSPTRNAGRPREFNPETVLTRVTDLFWEKGYEGTSLNDIMQATQLKKGSLYSIFGGKRDMYLKALEHYDMLHVQSACAMLTDASIGSPMFRMDIFLSAPIKAAFETGDRRGCFLCNASADIADRDAQIAKYIATAYDQLEAALKTACAEHMQGMIETEITARARSLLTVYTGLRIMARTAYHSDGMEDSKRIALDF